MYFLIDHRMPEEAKKKLSHYGELLEVKTSGITYPAISGHPDIFFCQGPDRLISAPNVPGDLTQRLKDYGIHSMAGELPVGPEYPFTARYNAVATDRYLIHHFRHTDTAILQAFQNLIPVPAGQGYCRCNLLWLHDDFFITSDPGIFKALKKHTANLLFVNPAGIVLEGFSHGFFGGCCGIAGDKMLVCGSLHLFPNGDDVRDFVRKAGFGIVELHSGALADVGGIIAMPSANDPLPEQNPPLVG